MKITRAQATTAICLWLLALTLATTITIGGCGANSKYVVHSGSIPIITACPSNAPAGTKCDDGGSFDSHSADFLSEERAFLDAFKGKTEPKPVAEALEYAEKQYGITKTAYLTWRTAQTAAALQDLNTQKTNLTSAIGGVASAQKASGQ